MVSNDLRMTARDLIIFNTKPQKDVGFFFSNICELLYKDNGVVPVSFSKGLSS